jgi:dihydrodipicolinate synthase/N-acetylneuraminate lyase
LSKRDEGSNVEANAQRRGLVDVLFPEGCPRLWCPPLTHFDAAGRIDAGRIRRHLEVLAPYARGLLVPGSTGEGWDLADAEVRELLAIVLDAAGRLGLRVLIGVLRRNLSEMLAVIQGTASWLCDRSGAASNLAAMCAAGVVGFTVCAPCGAELTQDQLQESLALVLELGHPTALYQLPQVTQNEMAAETVARLAAAYPNFYLLKDTSGVDRVALAGLDLGGIFLVRGAEGQYARWISSGGGPYHGFLLSSANCLARELATMMNALSAGERREADQMADRVERVLAGCFRIVADHPAANPFTNANKILDHVMAYGSEARDHSPPYLRGGRQLPAEFVDQAFELVADNGLLPAQGYLQ